MSHPEQQQFCRRVQEQFPASFVNCRVLDVGSLDINGSNRHLFSGCSYVGLDIGPGPNVDVVSLAHEYSAPAQSYDTIISTEMLEHDRFYADSLCNMYRMLKSGGLLLITCAAPGRPEHGTSRTSPNDSPLTVRDSRFSDYYRNISCDDFLAVLPSALFSSSSVNQVGNDLQFYGIKI